MFKGAAIVMGVTSCGKTTLGEALAEKMNVKFIEGDKLHPAENIAKMTAGQPLNDDDRWPWLQKIGEALQGQDGVIASCSALKKSYRDLITKNAKRPVLFIHLHGSKELLASRIAARKNHFMPPSLLDSQLATLEKPAPPEKFITIDLAFDQNEQLNQALARLAEI